MVGDAVILIPKQVTSTVTISYLPNNHCAGCAEKNDVIKSLQRQVKELENRLRFTRRAK